MDYSNFYTIYSNQLISKNNLVTSLELLTLLFKDANVAKFAYEISSSIMKLEGSQYSNFNSWSEKEKEEYIKDLYPSFDISLDNFSDEHKIMIGNAIKFIKNRYTIYYNTMFKFSK